MKRRLVSLIVIFSILSILLISSTCSYAEEDEQNRLLTITNISEW